MRKNKPLIAVLMAMACVSFPSLSYAGLFHHHHHHHTPPPPDYNDQDKYGNLNEFTGKGDKKFDSMVKNDNNANLKDDHKSSLADDWKAGFDLKCVDWKITGGCVWLRITPFSVSVKHSFKVSHYSPDAIVEVFHDINHTPASYAKLNNKIAKSLGNSVFSGLAFKGQKQNNDDSDGDGFHDIHIMGNPLIMLHDSTIGSLYRSMGYCNSGVIPFETYMHSFTDVEWRLGLWETVNALRYSYKMVTGRDDIQIIDHGANAIGGSLWGDLYPRIGVTENPSPFIGAAVVALRGAVLATSSSGIHTLLKIQNSNSGKVFSDGVVDIQNGKWKVLLPKHFTGRQCTTMPFAGVSNYTGTKEPETNSRNYVFQLWRNYQCCKRKGTFISSY